MDFRFYRAIMACMIVCLSSPSSLAGGEDGNPGQIEFSIGGRLKIDSIFSSGVSEGRKDTNASDLGFIPTSIPLTGSESTNKYNTDVRASRLWSTWHVPLGTDRISAYLEVDFLDSKNVAGGGKRLSNLPRLRHYYLSHKGFSLGQTHTTFFNISSFPELNDVNGPLGVFIVRQRLLRYSHGFDWGEAELSVEDSETVLHNTDGSRLSSNDERYPDIAAKFTLQRDWGNLSLSVLLREIIYKDESPVLVEDKKWGGALNLSGRVNFLQRDNLRFSIAWGNALGRYLSFAAFSDGSLDSQGRIHLHRIIGANIAYQHWWTDTLRTNIALGAAQADIPLVAPASTENKEFYSSHLNLLWSPRLSTTFGVEWLHGYRQRDDGKSGNMDRVQITASYRF